MGAPSASFSREEICNFHSHHNCQSVVMHVIDQINVDSWWVDAPFFPYLPKIYLKNLINPLFKLIRSLQRNFLFFLYYLLAPQFFLKNYHCAPIWHTSNSISRDPISLSFYLFPQLHLLFVSFIPS